MWQYGVSHTRRGDMPQAAGRPFLGQNSFHGRAMRAPTLNVRLSYKPQCNNFATVLLGWGPQFRLDVALLKKDSYGVNPTF